MGETERMRLNPGVVSSEMNFAARPSKAVKGRDSWLLTERSVRQTVARRIGGQPTFLAAMNNQSVEETEDRFGRLSWRCHPATDDRPD